MSRIRREAGQGMMQRELWGARLARWIAAVTLAFLALPGAVVRPQDPGSERTGADRRSIFDLSADRESGVGFELKGVNVSAYLVAPPSREVRGGVVVGHEIWGLNAQIKGVARRLADAGYAVIVPDLYHGQVTDDPDRAQELARGLKEKKAAAMLRAAAAFLKSTDELAEKKIAVVGFSMGGRAALLSALDGREIAGAVVFYGSPLLEERRVRALKAPLLGFYGEDDPDIPVEDVRSFGVAAKELGKKVETRVYPRAGHAFFNESLPTYNASAASDAWKRTLDFLDQTLVEPDADRAARAGSSD